MSHNFSEHLESKDKVNAHVFYIVFDLLDNGIGQDFVKFNDELFNDIPEFVFGPEVYKSKIANNGVVPTIREAMKAVYSIPEIQEAQREYLNSLNTEDKYVKRGEFGELLLYHLLHEYFNANALISKIYFRDTGTIPAHGFDAVHVDVDQQTLWLGESKLYKSGTRAIDELVKDVIGYTETNGTTHKGHFNVDFFNSEFQIITNRVHDSQNEYPEFIKTLIDPKTKVLDKLANINVALFAGFDSKVIKDGFTKEIKEKITKESNTLFERSENKLEKGAWNNYLNIYLFLFPLGDKNEFVSKLHQKLKGAQQI